MRKTKSLILLPLLAVLILVAGCGGSDDSRDIGEATSNWRLLTPNDKIKVSGFSDPDIPEITVYFTRADRGGIKGAVGLAEDKSNASVSAVLTRPFIGKVPDKVVRENGVEVFRQSQSAFFKHMMVKRFYDETTGCVIYMVHSREIVEGGYKSSVSAVCLNAGGK